jgi:hypothetical protein
MQLHPVHLACQDSIALLSQQELLLKKRSLPSSAAGEHGEYECATILADN